ncbi:MAG: 2-keto-D-gluconate dehydrogenase, partial [Ottowia sp.]|nr:2-keto-D-gluconate dehydrogenase [Ottowia sp.]
QAHQQLARELRFVFAEVPESAQPAQDFQRVRLDRDMGHYEDALAWAHLILQGESPLTGAGRHRALSLLFPMEKVFEAFVARHLPRQLKPPYTLRAQASNRSLVQHMGKDWFSLRPDLLVREGGTNRLVLDTKWKLLNQANTSDKYGLSQADFYQLHAYGHNYLDDDGNGGDVVLIYPKTDTFDRALPEFKFPKSPGLRLWVLPFCLGKRELILPDCCCLNKYFSQGVSAKAGG